MLTNNGIELDLKESKYKTQYKDYIFYFSSEFYKNKFEENLTGFTILETAKIKNKYKVNINLELYLAVVLYKKIEKRGFLIISKNKGFLINEYSCFEATSFC